MKNPNFKRFVIDGLTEIGQGCLKVNMNNQFFENFICINHVCLLFMILIQIIFVYKKRYEFKNPNFKILGLRFKFI